VKDICVVRYQHLVEVSELTVETVRPDYIIVSGKNLTYTVRVLVDEAEAQYEVLDDSRVKVYVTNALARVGVNIKIYVDVGTDEKSEDMIFDIGNETRSGPARITQLVVKMLTTTPGTDKFDTTFGGGLYASMRTISVSDNASVAGVVSACVQRIKQQIIADQSSRLLDPSETLVDIRFSNLKSDPATLSVSFELQVVTANGEANVTLSTGGAP
jgi:hypothetical protein